MFDYAELHWGSSEHMMEGASDAEFQMYFYPAPYTSVADAITGGGEVFALAIMLSTTDYAAELCTAGENPDLEELFNLTTLSAMANGTSTPSTIANPSVLQKYIPGSSGASFTYKGSLTQPDCAPNVIWAVKEAKACLSSAQLSNLESQVYVGGAPLTSNARPIQSTDLGEFPVFHSTNDSSWCPYCTTSPSCNQTIDDAFQDAIFNDTEEIYYYENAGCIDLFNHSYGNFSGFYKCYNLSLTYSQNCQGHGGVLIGYNVTRTGTDSWSNVYSMTIESMGCAPYNCSGSGLEDWMERNRLDACRRQDGMWNGTIEKDITCTGNWVTLPFTTPAYSYFTLTTPAPGSTGSGPTGTAGSTVSGPTGTAGSTVSGPTGTAGSTVSGPTGTAGSTVSGPTGTAGSTVSGPTGTAGSTVSGPTGTAGSTVSGPTGTAGSTVSGPTGTAGSTVSGPTGTAGSTVSGPTGTAGSTTSGPTVITTLPLSTPENYYYRNHLTFSFSIDPAFIPSCTDPLYSSDFESAITDQLLSQLPSTPDMYADPSEYIFTIVNLSNLICPDSNRPGTTSGALTVPVYVQFDVFTVDSAYAVPPVFSIDFDLVYLVGGGNSSVPDLNDGGNQDTDIDSSDPPSGHPTNSVLTEICSFVDTVDSSLVDPYRVFRCDPLPIDIFCQQAIIQAGVASDFGGYDMLVNWGAECDAYQHYHPLVEWDSLKNSPSSVACEVDSTGVCTLEYNVPASDSVLPFCLVVKCLHGSCHTSTIYERVNPENPICFNGANSATVFLSYVVAGVLSLIL